jgi:uncharacterized membrane protein YeaQ/YmgE (transglycosylase-associated protein family)
MLGLIGTTAELGIAFCLWLLAGLLAGWLAGVITRGRGYGCCADILLGWFGSIIGGLVIGGILGLRTSGGWLASVFAAFTGALILLLAVRLRLTFGSRNAT